MARSILVVEDNELAAGALEALFQSFGYDVRTADSVRAAIEACCGAPTDLMLLDISLPDGDGLSVLPAVAARDRLPGITVALTGHDDPAITRRCLDAGCREVLLKPVQPRELLARIAIWLA
jgi:two-component system OmpR family response regulator